MAKQDLKQQLSPRERETEEFQKDTKAQEGADTRCYEREGKKGTWQLKQARYVFQEGL